MFLFFKAFDLLHHTAHITDSVHKTSIKSAYNEVNAPVIILILRYFSPSVSTNFSG